jgi:glycine/D-amino acid oxidase-like deaminating enzyme
MPGYGRRFWAERTSPHRRRKYPAFRGKDDVDVVVIGGGLTGCMAASLFAANGARVVLLEAERLADAGTAGGLGAILPEPDARFRQVDDLAGRRPARTAWQEARRSALDLAATLRRLSIKADLSPTSLVINAPRPDDAVLLRKEQQARKSAGLDAAWLTTAAAHAEIGTDSAGAIRSRGAFTIDPVRAALGFAAAADRKGARIFERSAVRRTRFTRKQAEVVLASGSVRARLVFVATASPGSLFSQLRRHVRVLDGYAVVTERLTAAMRREAGRRTAVLTEIRQDRPWMRWMPEDRVLFAGAVSPPVGARQRDSAVVQRTAQLMYELSLRHPAISGLPAAWGWRVPIACTPDGLPWIGVHRNYPFHFFALALGWHGESLAWFAARAALRHWQGESRRSDDQLGFARYL